MLKSIHHSRGYYLIVLPALLIYFWLGVNTAVSKSITNDEPTHLLRGYSLWTTGDLQYQGAHTPFSHWIIGSLLPTESTLPDLQNLPEWGGDRVQLAREMLFENDTNTALQRVLFLGRTPVILLGLLLGAMVVQWARALAGKQAAWMAAILFAFASNWLGVVSLATTDGPLTVTFLGAVWGMWWWVKRPFRYNWLLAGILFGLALSSKVTALLLLPVSLILLYSQWERGEEWLRPFLRWLSLLPIAFLVLWACYGFEFGSIPGVPVSIPAPTYAANFIKVQTHVEESHLTYLLGNRGQSGWWYYFIVAFFVKTPAVTLILLLIGIAAILWRRDLKQAIFLWLPAGALFAAASLTGLNIGYRHILPVLPFVWLVGVWGIQYKGTKEQRNKEAKSLLCWLSLVFLGWYVIGSLRQHPHHLAYFNDFVGGSANGHVYLSDSNIDWGQDLNLLAEYATKQNEPLWVSYNGVPNISDFDNFYQLAMDEDTGLIANFNSANPVPGRYALSVTHLHGTSLREPDIFDWFRRQTPVDQLGYSILIYDVPADVDGEWIAHCSPALLDAADAEALVNRVGLRHLSFDCSQSWIFPNNGTAGWYVLPTNNDINLPTLSKIPESILVHEPTKSAPAYAIYYWPGDVDLVDELTSLAGMASLADGTELKRPFLINNTLQFLGYQQAGATWLTAWQIESSPNQPLSIMGHLHTSETKFEVADGLGFSSEQWMPKDIIVQQHMYSEEKTAVFMRTGIYNYVSGYQPSLANRADTTFQLKPNE